MAGSAIFRGRLVENNRFRGDDPRQLVALCAAHVLMSPAQGKLRPLLVVKERRLPLHAVVALGAACDVRMGELFPMNVFMAVLALGRRGFEVHVDQLGFKARRLMAIDAGRRTVCPSSGNFVFE